MIDAEPDNDDTVSPFPDSLFCDMSNVDGCINKQEFIQILFIYYYITGSDSDYHANISYKTRDQKHDLPAEHAVSRYYCF
jgi:hypothetical protein